MRRKHVCSTCTCSGECVTRGLCVSTFERQKSVSAASNAPSVRFSISNSLRTLVSALVQPARNDVKAPSIAAPAARTCLHTHTQCTNHSERGALDAAWRVRGGWGRCVSPWHSHVNPLVVIHMLPLVLGHRFPHDGLLPLALCQHKEERHVALGHAVHKGAMLVPAPPRARTHCRSEKRAVARGGSGRRGGHCVRCRGRTARRS